MGQGNSLYYNITTNQLVDLLVQRDYKVKELSSLSKQELWKLFKKPIQRVALGGKG